jgi:hypothetical protein
LIRSTLFDTGANGSINFRDVKRYLYNARKSELDITVANKSKLDVGLDGLLPISVVNTAQHDGIGKQVDFDVVTTTADVAVELFSFDPLYRNGWGCHCRSTLEQGGSVCELYKPATADGDAIRIPMRYDWDGGGGFWLDYMVRGTKKEHNVLLARYREDAMLVCNADTAEQVKYFDVAQTQKLVKTAKADGACGSVRGPARRRS